jgi:adenylate cyclase
MKLRQKTLLPIGILLIFLVGILSIILTIITLSSFVQLEQQNVYQNLHRLTSALNEDINMLQRSARDYAEWDDTYHFVDNLNLDYQETNLVAGVFETLDIDIILIFNEQQQLVFAGYHEPETEEVIELPEIFATYLNSDSILAQLDSVKGVLLVDNEVYIIASQPILTSERTGPINGNFVMAKKINSDRLESLKSRTRLEITLITQDITTVQPKFANSANTLIVETTDKNIISGYTLVHDIHGQAGLLLKIDILRDIYQQGLKSITYLIISLLVVGISFGITALIILEKIILSPLAQLSKDIANIGTNNNLSARLNCLNGDDELSVFAAKINWMLDNISQNSQEIYLQKQKVEKLLLNVLPKEVASQLTNDNQVLIADHFEEVTILFADIVGFTDLSAKLEPIELVNLLNEFFSDFDNIVEKLNLEKIKTIGDAYMVAAGLPMPRSDHAEAIAEMALLMQESMRNFRLRYSHNIHIRIGINSGVVIAGVIGKRKFIYDLWGDAVNIASRMESSGEPGNIQITASTYEKIKHNYVVEERGLVYVKGKGEMLTYWLKSRKTNPQPKPLAL